MNLIIDIGNTLIKLAVFQDDKLLKKFASVKIDFKNKFEEVKIQYPLIGRILVSNVSEPDFLKLKKPKKVEEIFFLSPELKLPFVNKYSTPKTLGHDRIALMAAASKFFKGENVLVIDAGTCLTFDFLNSENEYLGGAISPGLKMRYDALHNFTSKLPLLEPDDEVELIGNSTKNSINSGVINGITKEIDGVINEYSALYPNTKILLTGGDAQILSKRLKNSIFANSNFLLEGLNYILEINNNQ